MTPAQRTNAHTSHPVSFDHTHSLKGSGNACYFLSQLTKCDLSRYLTLTCGGREGGREGGRGRGGTAVEGEGTEV